MKYEQEIREILIANTIRLIAEGGFEKATTKALTHSGVALNQLKMNEVYIYRLFGSKENLYSVAFSTLDNEFFSALQHCLQSHQFSENSTQEALYKVFCDTWHFLLKNEDRCRCYIRYYYSIYFKDQSQADHNRLFKTIIEDFTPLFKEEADVRSILHSVLTTLLDFAVRVYNGDLENTEENMQHIFNVAYCMMMTYFKNDLAIKVSEPTLI